MRLQAYGEIGNAMRNAQARVRQSFPLSIVPSGGWRYSLRVDGPGKAYDLLGDSYAKLIEGERALIVPHEGQRWKATRALLAIVVGRPHPQRRIRFKLAPIHDDDDPALGGIVEYMHWDDDTFDIAPVIATKDIEWPWLLKGPDPTPLRLMGTSRRAR